MMTARELRGRAWERLSEGGWLMAIGAFGLYWLMGNVAAQLISRVGVATGGIEMLTFGDMLRQTGWALPAELPAELLQVTVPKPRLWYQPLQFVATMLVDGALLAGWTVFTVSVMRRGANALQVFSGFPRFLSMGWLMLAQTLRIALWSLLLLVPGIVAFYAYRMAFFLKADHPEWTASKALAESRRMMDGHKWRLACLDASFIGWMLLVFATFGAAGLFVNPYMGVTFAAFYEELLDREEQAS